MADNPNELVFKAKLDTSSIKKGSQEIANVTIRSVADIKNIFQALDTQQDKLAKSQYKAAAQGEKSFVKWEKQVASLNETVKTATKDFEKFAKLTKPTKLTTPSKAISGIQSKTQERLKAQQGYAFGFTQKKITSQSPSSILKSAQGGLKRLSSKDLKSRFDKQEKDIIGSFKSISPKASKEKEEEDKTEKKAGFLSKLIGRIRNIGIYRLIRSAMKWLTQGVGEGLQQLAQYSDRVNSTLSNVNASLNQVRNTLAVSFASVLQSLEPIITTLSSSLVDLINQFNLALAKMQGQTAYVKAKKQVEDYAKSVQKARKFSFDAFEVLSGDNKENPFEMGNIDEDATGLSKTFEKLFQIIEKIANIVGTIITKLQESGFFDNLLTIIEKIAIAMGDIIIKLLDSGAMNAILDVIIFINDVGAKILGVVVDLISYLSQIGALEPILLGIAAAFIAIKVAAIASAIASAANLMFSNPLLGIALSTIALGTLGVVASKLFSYSNSGVQGFANGGFTNANVFVANEGRKREWIGKAGSSSAIVNDRQMDDIMRDAVRQGVYEGLSQASFDTSGATGGDQEIVLKVDNYTLGRVVASSQGFKAEAIRIGLI